MRIAVIGAGGVGGYFGGRLAAAGHQVTFVARGRNLEALRTQGIRLEDPTSSTVIDSVSATDDPKDAGPADAVIVGVKSWQVPELAPTLKPLVDDQTMVLPLQNGVEAPDRLGDTLGHRHVLGGVCVIIAYLAGPGHVYHVGGQPAIEMGPIAPSGDTPTGTVEALRAALVSAGVHCTLSQDIRAAMWRKFLLITSYGGIGAVSRVPVGVTRSVPETRQLIEEAMAEVVSVARAYGVALDERDIRAMMAQVDAFRPESTASMQRDIADGRPSELFDQSGAVVRLGTQAGVSTPVHRFIYSCLLPAERRARGESSD